MTKKVDLLAAFSEAQHAVPAGTKWAHYKGGTYIVVGHGFDTERQEVNVHYARLTGPNYDRVIEAAVKFDRPVSQFLETHRFKEIR